MLTVLPADVDGIVATGVSADDLLELDDGWRYDLIHGELIRMSPAGFDHGNLANELGYWLRAYMASRPNFGRVAGAETGFRLAANPDTVLGPDVSVVRSARLPESGQRSGYLPLAPDLAVEIVSPSDRWTSVDDKVTAYLAAGVPLVWVVDPRRRAILVYSATAPVKRLQADHGDVLDGDSVLPGFSLALAELFSVMDR